MDQLPSDELLYQLEHIHDSKAPGVLASLIICFAFACTSVLLRWISRRMCRAGIGIDDYMILVALVLALGCVIILALALPLGFGKHSILLKDTAYFLKLVFAISIVYMLGIATLKFSVILLYQRIFGINRRFKIASWCLALFIFCYTIVGIFLWVFQYTPVQGSWDITINAVKNVYLGNLPTTLAALNVVSDFLTLALPMPLILRLQMPTKRRIQVALLFLLGGFVCICSIVRATLMYKMSVKDPSWSDADPAIWSMAEMGAGIVGACLPTLCPLLRRYRGAFEEKMTRYRQRVKQTNHVQKIPDQSMRTDPKISLASESDESKLSTNDDSMGRYTYEQAIRACV